TREERSRELLAPRATPRLSHSRYLEASGDLAHLVRGHLTRHAQPFVDRGENEILQHLTLIAVDDRRIDFNRGEAQLPVDRHFHHAAARRGVHGPAPEFLLNARELRLHLLRLLE